MNWLTLAPWILSAVFAFGGFTAYEIERGNYQEAKATIAQRDTTISTMQTRQAENIAAAVKKVNDANAQDQATSQRIITVLTVAKQNLEERANAAETALANVPPTVTPAGCPAPIDTPVFRAFLDGLPRDD